MKDPKTTFTDLEQAYQDKVKRIYHPDAYRKEKLYKERKAKGICVICGVAKITKFQRKQRFTSCLKCREKERNEVTKNVKNL